MSKPDPGIKNENMRLTNISDKKTGKALGVTLNILNVWGCNKDEKQAVLGLNKTHFNNALKDPENLNLSDKQLERISYILNIHHSLRIVFSNKNNSYNFIKMVNSNPYFNGSTPLSLMANGSMSDLCEVFKHIEAMHT